MTAYNWVKGIGLGCVVVAMMAACSPKSDTVETTANQAQEDTQKVEERIAESAIIVSDALIRTPLGGKNVTAGYFSLTLGQDDRLLYASTEMADKIELHTVEMTDGVMQMREMDGVDIKAGQAVVFAPKGEHLMIFGVKPLNEGDIVEVTFGFESGRTATANFTVGMPDVSKGAGHDH